MLVAVALGCAVNGRRQVPWSGPWGGAVGIQCSNGVRDLAFISYSHEDKKWLDRLMVLLDPFLETGRLEIWADPYVQTGDDWHREIERGLKRARVGVFLVSPEFAASKFIRKVELPAVLVSAEKDELTVFCVPIREMVGGNEPGGVIDLLGLRRFQWARPPGQPLGALPDAERHAALVRIVWDLVKLFPATAEREIAAVAAVTAPVSRWLLGPAMHSRPFTEFRSYRRTSSSGPSPSRG